MILIILTDCYNSKLKALQSKVCVFQNNGNSWNSSIELAKKIIQLLFLELLGGLFIHISDRIIEDGNNFNTIEPLNEMSSDINSCKTPNHWIPPERGYHSNDSRPFVRAMVTASTAAASGPFQVVGITGHPTVSVVDGGGGGTVMHATMGRGLLILAQKEGG